MTKIINLIKNNKLFSNGILIVVSSMFINVINYLYHLIFGRFLGPVEYGTLASLYSILYIVSIVPQSTSFAVVKFISSAKSDEERWSIYKAVNQLAIKVALVLSSLMVLSSWGLANFMNISNMTLILLAVPVLFFGIVTLVNQATSQGLMDFKGLIIPNLISSIGKFVFGLILIVMGYKVFGAMVGVVLGSILAYMYSRYVIINKSIKVKTNRYKLGSFLKYTLPILIISLAYTSIFTLDLVLVKHYFDPHEAGIYASLSMLGKMIFFAISPTVSVVFPEVSSRKANGKSYGKVALFAFLAALFGCIVISLFYSTFPEFVIKLLYGTLYLDGSVYLSSMSIYLSLYTLTYMLTSFHLSIDRIWVSYLALSIAIAQVVAITIWHGNIAQIINISIYLLSINLVCLLVSLFYNLREEKITIKK